MQAVLLGWSAIPLEAQAAWVQAVFSIVGIAVAIAIPAVQHFRDRRDKTQHELKEAKSLALMLIPNLESWVSNLSEYQVLLQQHLNAHFPGTIDWSSIAEALKLGEQGKQLAPKSHLMGAIAYDAQQFFYYLASAQQAARKHVSGRTDGTEDRLRLLGVSELIDNAKSSALKARDAAHRLFEK